jgi:hypothetical protein
MKRDGRGFDHRTLEAIRLIAVERVRGRERPSAVVASFGFHSTTIYKWLKAAPKPGVGRDQPRILRDAITDRRLQSRDGAPSWSLTPGAP